MLRENVIPQEGLFLTLTTMVTMCVPVADRVVEYFVTPQDDGFLFISGILLFEQVWKLADQSVHLAEVKVSIAEESPDFD